MTPLRFHLSTVFPFPTTSNLELGLRVWNEVRWAARAVGTGGLAIAESRRCP
jgi:hypothetical protein